MTAQAAPPPTLPSSAGRSQSFAAARASASASGYAIATREPPTPPSAAYSRPLIPAGCCWHPGCGGQRSREHWRAGQRGRRPGGWWPGACRAQRRRSHRQTTSHCRCGWAGAGGGGWSRPAPPPQAMTRALPGAGGGGCRPRAAARRSRIGRWGPGIPRPALHRAQWQMPGVRRWRQIHPR